ELDKRFIEDDTSLQDIKSVVFIQCVGSREPERPYCSKVCCTHSIKNALYLKELNPEMDIYILYRDIRTYGERERLYLEARRKGIVFIRYSLESKPEVTRDNNGLSIKVKDHVLKRNIIIQPDLVVLASAIIPYKDEELAQLFKVPLNEDGFFVESHPKLAPSEFATDGVYLCGMAHYPKPIDEAIAQSKAAASRAMTLLTKDKVLSQGNIAVVDPFACAGCGMCVSVCPYGAPYIMEEGRFAGKASINPVLCKGCGLCVASCRSGAINLNGFTTNQIMSMINELGATA
ncbi:MAG: 4Fe-4S ferredoxin, partial [Deltaproteobacteria bacterium]